MANADVTIKVTQEEARALAGVLEKVKKAEEVSLGSIAIFGVIPIIAKKDPECEASYSDDAYDLIDAHVPDDRYLLVPVSEAWASGGCHWTDDQRRAFAQDEDNLLALSPRLNRSKGASGPVSWRKTSGSYWRDHLRANRVDARNYARRWVDVKIRHGLSMTFEEWEALSRYLTDDLAGQPEREE